MGHAFCVRFVQELSHTYRAVNTVSTVRTGRLILYGEMVAVCFETHYIDTRRVREVRSLKVRIGGTYGYHCALKW